MRHRTEHAARPGKPFKLKAGKRANKSQPNSTCQQRQIVSAQPTKGRMTHLPKNSNMVEILARHFLSRCELGHAPDNSEAKRLPAILSRKLARYVGSGIGLQSLGFVRQSIKTVQSMMKAHNGLPNLHSKGGHRSP